eukprot:CAMPEP_0201904790 /NCGR_PEP_ID=MMETSP0902-20130614/56179_1 /ASSEMBLY_ACC=CAM_ASM_000551 /TAXON_ID=420261 /ORGANISM="Thalassiosira antarctica, Strain CCMP982" /LENGTH=123 /DNA_ID=CAMNT_0048438889 /DNA_START=402 /DNA_END=773 /DNA_ORIENTATION=+
MAVVASTIPLIQCMSMSSMSTHYMVVPTFAFAWRATAAFPFGSFTFNEQRLLRRVTSEDRQFIVSSSTLLRHHLADYEYVLRSLLAHVAYGSRSEHYPINSMYEHVKYVNSLHGSNQRNCQTS